MASFQQAEVVLAYFGEMIYEAKVLKVERVAAGRYRYFIHYNKWNEKYDEWADADRLMPLNEATKKKAEVNNSAVAAQQNALKSTKKRPGGGKDAAAGGVSGGKKRKLDASKEVEDPLEGAMRLAMPFSLKRQLVEDWEFITQRHMLVKLPVPVSQSAAAMLDRYVASLGPAEGDPEGSSSSTSAAKSKKGRKDGKVAAAASSSSSAVAASSSSSSSSSSAAALSSDAQAAVAAKLASMPHILSARSIAAGLMHYFDRSAGTFLLYRFERYQYEAMLREHVNSGLRISEMLGAEHFLRLFIKLPELLLFSNITKDESDQFAALLTDMLKFYGKKDVVAELFSGTHYAKAVPAYVRQFDDAMAGRLGGSQKLALQEMIEAPKGAAAAT